MARTLQSSTHLLLPLFHHEELIGPVRHREGKPILEGIAAVVVVADAVLIDVVHGEGVRLAVVLAIVGAFDCTVTRNLHNGEGNRFSLCWLGVK